MDNFAATLAALRDLKESSIVDDYAVGGAMALIFWTEPTATYDLDVFVLLRQESMLVSLTPIYEWARAHGYPEQDEHIVVAGIPVQIIPAHTRLTEEAVNTAVELDYGDEAVRVIRAEYLIAMALEGSARTRKRMERVATLLDEDDLVDRELLSTLLERYKLQLPEHLQ